MSEEGRGVHVIFGAGQVGPALARLLAGRGHRVRVVRRSAAPAEGGVETVRADALDPAQAAEAARGAAVVYHCMNAPYFAATWQRELPRLQESLVAAAGRAGARLVVLDNLYALGRTGGRPMNEETPLRPCSRKGEIRARLQEALEAANARGDVRAVAGRAADFFGPGGVNSYFEGRLFAPLLAGKPARTPVDPDTPHTYHFIPDVAAGLAALGEDPDAEGRYMLPCRPAVTTRELIGFMARALGRQADVRRIPPLLLKALGVVVPLLRELDEMAYQWEEPFLVDDGKFRARYGDRSTPLEEAARATAEWGAAAFGPGAAARAT
jgi:nucleoside-diphosphate-sugar epimerase